MANKTLSGTRIQLRRDTASNWSAKNPVLLTGEAGYDTTNKILKIGTGSTAWNSLPAAHPTSGVTAGSYGPSADSNSKFVSVPYLTINNQGHVTLARQIHINTDKELVWEGNSTHVEGWFGSDTILAIELFTLTGNKIDYNYIRATAIVNSSNEHGNDETSASSSTLLCMKNVSVAGSPQNVKAIVSVNTDWEINEGESVTWSYITITVYDKNDSSTSNHNLRIGRIWRL